MVYNKLVSVVMPVHNGERFLREAIESVLNQTYANFEFLIIENCSTDSSVDIIKSYKDERIKLIVEKDCGQVQAYNRGFHEAKGEYIFIHDHDDISHLKRFEKQLKCMIDYDIDICGSLMNFINEKHQIIGKTAIQKQSNEISEMIIYNYAAIHNSSVCIKKDVFEKVGLWNIKYYPLSDVEFYLRANNQKYKFYKIHEYLYSWRKHKKQLSFKQSGKSLRKIKKIELEYLFYNKNELKEKDRFYYKSLIYYYTDYLILALLNIIISIAKGKIDKKSFRYFLILAFLGIPLKIFRKYNLVNSKLFISTRKQIDKVL